MVGLGSVGLDVISRFFVKKAASPYISSLIWRKMFGCDDDFSMESRDYRGNRLIRFDLKYFRSKASPNPF